MVSVGMATEDHISGGFFARFEGFNICQPTIE
jgi:hypothetical protein